MQKIGDNLTIGNGQRIPLSRAIATHGFVFVSGQLALDDGRLVAGDITDQTHTTLDNIAEVLALSGLELKDVCKATVWLSKAEDFPPFNVAYAQRMSQPYPARSTVVAGLLIPGALVEIEVCARQRS